MNVIKEMKIKLNNYKDSEGNIHVLPSMWHYVRWSDNKWFKFLAYSGCVIPDWNSTYNFKYECTTTLGYKKKFIMHYRFYWKFNLLNPLVYFYILISFLINIFFCGIIESVSEISDWFRKPKYNEPKFGCMCIDKKFYDMYKDELGLKTWHNPDLYSLNYEEYNPQKFGAT